jgi:hypothetical protein
MQHLAKADTHVDEEHEALSTCNNKVRHAAQLWKFGAPETLTEYDLLEVRAEG